MDWADELAASVSGPQVVNDSKTPSGTVHVGSLRGPVILDVITRALRARDLETRLLYGIDDLDPMDAQALLTPDAVEREMGRPLAHVPDQEDDGHASYARHHAGKFIETFGSSEAIHTAATSGPTANAMRVVLQPDDLAFAIAFFASPKCHRITGQTLHVNAGSMMP